MPDYFKHSQPSFFQPVTLRGIETPFPSGHDPSPLPPDPPSPARKNAESNIYLGTRLPAPFPPRTLASSPFLLMLKSKYFPPPASALPPLSKNRSSRPPEPPLGLDDIHSSRLAAPDLPVLFVGREESITAAADVFFFLPMLNRPLPFLTFSCLAAFLADFERSFRRL